MRCKTNNMKYLSVSKDCQRINYGDVQLITGIWYDGVIFWDKYNQHEPTNVLFLSKNEFFCYTYPKTSIKMEDKSMEPMDLGIAGPWITMGQTHRMLGTGKPHSREAHD